MKVAIVLVAVFVVFAAPSTSHDTRGISDAIQKLKDFLAYLKSPELAAIVQDIQNHLRQAPEKAAECFKTASEGSKGDRDAAMQELQDILSKALHLDDSDNKNLFEKLIGIAKGINDVIHDPNVAKDLQALSSQFKGAVEKAMGCFKDELLAVKGDVDKVVSDIRSKFGV